MNWLVVEINCGEFGSLVLRWTANDCIPSDIGRYCDYIGQSNGTIYECDSCTLQYMIWNLRHELGGGHHPVLLVAALVDRYSSSRWWGSSCWCCSLLH